jgi:hypothetical protein
MAGIYRAELFILEHPHVLNITIYEIGDLFLIYVHIYITLFYKRIATSGVQQWFSCCPGRGFRLLENKAFVAKGSAGKSREMIDFAYEIHN